jgi:hypothetical protein
MLSGQRYALVSLLRGSNRGTHCTGGWIGPGGGLDGSAEENVSSPHPPPDFEL